METLVDLGYQRGLTRDEFCARNPHPFLVLDRSQISLSKPLGFDTQTAPCAVLNEQMQKLADLESSGYRLGDGIYNHVLFRLTKQEANPYQSHIAVGRTGTVDVVIQDGRISKMHAYFERDSETGGYRLVDVGSHNGTRVNGQRLQPREKTPVTFGDVIEFGSIPLCFCDAGHVYDLMCAMITR